MCNMRFKKKSQKINKVTIYLALLFLIIIFDQISKWLVLKHSSMAVINSRMFLSLNYELSIYIYLVIFLTIVILWFTIRQVRISIFGISMIVAGIISNFIDRMFRGGVVDYLKLPYFHGLMFNLADVFIIIGILIYLYETNKQN